MRVINIIIFIFCTIYFTHAQACPDYILQLKNFIHSTLDTDQMEIEIDISTVDKDNNRDAGKMKIGIQNKNILFSTDEFNRLVSDDFEVIAFPGQKRLIYKKNNSSNDHAGLFEELQNVLRLFAGNLENISCSPTPDTYVYSLTPPSPATTHVSVAFDKKNGQLISYHFSDQSPSAEIQALDIRYTYRLIFADDFRKAMRKDYYVSENDDDIVPTNRYKSFQLTIL